MTLNFTCCLTTDLFNTVSILSIIKRIDEAGFYSSLIKSYRVRRVNKELEKACTLCSL